MFFYALKWFVYLLILYILVQGIMSMQQQLTTKPKREQFSESKEETDVEPVLSENDKEEETPSVDDASQDPLDYPVTDELVTEVTKMIRTRFDTIKQQLDTQMEDAKKGLNDTIRTILRKTMKDSSTTTNTSREKLEEEINQAVDAEDDDAEDDDDDDDAINEEEETQSVDQEDTSEGFVDGMYDGITSPYCLNCSTI